jgi:diacylglycerol O-acyltransferase-1
MQPVRPIRWNASNIEQYWRLWNMPVHQWFVRHVYFPCLHLTKNKDVSVVVVFGLSAVFHELVIGVPMQLLRGWAFWGILSQVRILLFSCSFKAVLLHLKIH